MNQKQRRDRERRQKRLMEQLGSTCLARMWERGLTLTRTARLTGMDKSNLQKLLRGQMGSSLVGYVDLARALGWTPGEMLLAAFPDIKAQDGNYP